MYWLFVCQYGVGVLETVSMYTLCAAKGIIQFLVACSVKFLPVEAGINHGVGELISVVICLDLPASGENGRVEVVGYGRRGSKKKGRTASFSH